jgi:segregation and condensation protein B
MAKSRTKPVPQSGKSAARNESAAQGLSLDQLSEAYAQLLDKGDDPYREPPSQSDLPEALIAAAEPEDPQTPETGNSDTDDACPISPLSILEAMLFIGHPHNEPLGSKQVAGLMRGVRPDEIDELVVELNAAYAAEGRPFQIVSEGSGYRLSLCEEFTALREKFHGRVKEARLNQAAVDVLAIVAYNQPLTRTAVEKLRGKPSASVLNQLVRRELLRVDRPEHDPKSACFSTTERFLDLFGLDSLAELPRSQDLERA